MRHRVRVAKMSGSQHPHDKVVEMFSRFGDRRRLLDAPAGPGPISQKLKEADFDVVGADAEKDPSYRKET